MFPKTFSNVIIILLLSCISPSIFALEQPQNNIGFYIKNSGGRVDPETLPHVYKVFERVRAVARVNNRGLPQLVILKDLPGPPAFVLPDGNLVLTQQALNVIYGGVPHSEGNARLAFVLGHELAHLASDDFWSAEMTSLLQSKTLSGKINDSVLEHIEQDKKESMNKEIKADDKGFLYAAIAGFSVEKLLSEENDFLSYWVAQTHTQSSTTHPDAIQRSQILRESLNKKRESLEFFHMGVRLACFGRYQDAIYFFKKFQTVFPGPEVFNNLGICHLKMAIRKMPPAVAYKYWLPGIFDDKTLISQMNGPIFRNSDQIKIAENFLQQAVSYLKIATEEDPAFRIAYINLTVAYFYLDEIYKARGAIEDARKLQHDDPEVESLSALILFEEGQPMDTWSYAEGIFSDLASSHAADTLPLSIYYNWAKLLEARGRSAESQWQTLTKHKSELPLPIAQILCERLKDSSAVDQCLKEIRQVYANKGTSFHGSLPIQPGFDGWRVNKEQHPLNSWQKLPFNWQGEAASSGIIYVGPEDDVVLEMDGVVEMVVHRQPNKQAKALLSEYGQPHLKKATLAGELWFYDHWVALLEQNRIKEIWVTIEQP